MKVTNVWKMDEDEFDLKVDQDMRKIIMSELVKKAINALGKSFDDNEIYIYEALDCLQNWANLNEPNTFSTRKEEPVSEALERKEF